MMITLGSLPVRQAGFTLLPLAPAEGGSNFVATGKKAKLRFAATQKAKKPEFKK